MELQFKPNTLISKISNGHLEIKAPTFELTLKNLSSGISSALLKLSTFCNEEHLAEEVMQADGELSASHFYYYLELLKSKDLIIYKTPLLKLIPIKPISYAEKEFSTSFQLCPFALWRVKDGEIIIESPLAQALLIIQGNNGIHFFYALRKQSTFEELCKEFHHISSAHIQKSLSLLVAVNLLSFEKDSSNLAKWEVHDLYFHSRSRIGRHNNPYGGTYHMRGIIPPEPCIKSCPSQTVIPLEMPKEKINLSLIDVMEKRKSIREHGKKPLTLSELSAFLFYSARVKNTQIVGDQEFSSRPYPGGGARYELELYLVIYHCDGIEKGAYHYHPLEHALYKISELTEDSEELLKGACSSSGKQEYPQVLILMSARFQRVFWKYQSMGYAVILKDVGVLIQTMYLTATALGLAPCALGGGDSDLFFKAFKTNYLEETSVGEFMLGSRSPE